MRYFIDFEDMAYSIFLLLTGIGVFLFGLSLFLYIIFSAVVQFS